jgi:hypothetical protein
MEATYLIGPPWMTGSYHPRRALPRRENQRRRSRRGQPGGGGGRRGARGGDLRARSHCRRVVPRLIHFTPDSLTYSVLLFLKRQCDRNPGDLRRPRRRPRYVLGRRGRRQRPGAPGHRQVSERRQLAQKLAFGQLQLCTTARPLRTRIANIFGTSISSIFSETTGAPPRPQLGRWPTSAFCGCILTGMHAGLIGIFRADLTPFLSCRQDADPARVDRRDRDRQGG